MSTIRSALLAEFGRLRALWPVLETKPEHLNEIGKAVMRHEEKLKPEDVTRGIDRVVQECPTTGYPPGPHEVLGCVLREAQARNNRTLPSPRPAREGVSFAEWWHGLEADERKRHEAIGRMMAKQQPVAAGVTEQEDEEW